MPVAWGRYFSSDKRGLSGPELHVLISNIGEKGLCRLAILNRSSLNQFCRLQHACSRRLSLLLHTIIRRLPQFIYAAITYRLKSSSLCKNNLGHFVKQTRTLTDSSRSKIKTRECDFGRTVSLAESGFPGFDATAWFELTAPAGTPAPL